MVESGLCAKIAASAQTMSKGVVIVMANDVVVSIPALTAKRTLIRDKMEGNCPALITFDL